MHMATSKWELLLYCGVVAYLQLLVIRDGVAFSDAALNAAARATGGSRQLPGLRPGWLLGRQVDLSDAQWRDFRGGMPLLAAALGAFVGLSRLVRALSPSHRLHFYAAASLLFLLVLHGACSLFVAGLMTASFMLAKHAAGTRYGPALLWSFHCGAFLLVRAYNGFRFGDISPSLSWLDTHRGMLRWHIHYNLLLLRMLSHAMDAHWARTGRGAGGKGAGRGDRAPAVVGGDPDVDLKARVETSLPEPSYRNVLLYFSYCLYPPLYIAGPTMTFNSFASQLAAPPRITGRQVLIYLLRLAAALACLEALTHTLYVNSLLTHRQWLPYLQQAGGLEVTPVHHALAGFWVLVFMWLKFTVIWRFFTSAALLDGLQPPENMTRCVCNNYDIEGFWRSWHASYNRWLVRYVYVPLGGSRWRLVNVWAVFTFVALWHDLEPRLLGWAWIMAAAMAPEMAVKALARRPWLARHAGGWAYRQACAAAAAVNILVLMSANLVGFVVGPEGLPQLVEQVLGKPRTAAAVLFALFSGAQIMLALRDWEAARSQDRRRQAALQNAPSPAAASGDLAALKPATSVHVDQTETREFCAATNTSTVSSHSITFGAEGGSGASTTSNVVKRTGSAGSGNTLGW